MTCGQAQGRLSALLDAELPADEAREVREHLARCQACRAEQRRLESTVEALRQVFAEDIGQAPEVPTRLRRASRTGSRAGLGPLFWIATAAAVLILALGTREWWRIRRPSGQESLVISQIAGQLLRVPQLDLWIEARDGQGARMVLSASGEYLWQRQVEPAEWSASEWLLGSDGETRWFALGSEDRVLTESARVPLGGELDEDGASLPAGQLASALVATRELLFRLAHNPGSWTVTEAVPVPDGGLRARLAPTPAASGEGQRFESVELTMTVNGDLVAWTGFHRTRGEITVTVLGHPELAREQFRFASHVSAQATPAPVMRADDLGRLQSLGYIR